MCVSLEGYVGGWFLRWETRWHLYIPDHIKKQLSYEVWSRQLIYGYHPKSRISTWCSEPKCVLYVFRYVCLHYVVSVYSLFNLLCYQALILVHRCFLSVFQWIPDNILLCICIDERNLFMNCWKWVRPSITRLTLALSVVLQQNYECMFLLIWYCWALLPNTVQ